MRKKIQAVCPDGVLRVVHHGNPDSFLFRPAKTKIRGEKVFGFITKNPHGVIEFMRSSHQEEAKKLYRLSIRG